MTKTEFLALASNVADEIQLIVDDADEERLIGKSFIAANMLKTDDNDITAYLTLVAISALSKSKEK